MDLAAFDQARSARVLVAVTFHFVTDRVRFLAEVLRALSEFPVAAMEIAIVTNTFDEEQLALLRRLCAEILVDKHSSVRSYGGLSHPYGLAWCHKTIIAAEFAQGNDGRFTHFIYLEDDIRFSFENFCYFLEWREHLRAYGLLPAFVRTEYSAALRGFVATDAFWPVYVPAQAHVRLGDISMVNMPNPYNPCFVLDAALTEEYVRSPSFDHDASLTVCRWGVRERAAMGLCLENVPPPFQSRYVVPVSTETDMVLPAARISHLPNNYADNPHQTLGKIRIGSLFKGARALAKGGWWPSSSREATTARAQIGETKPPDRYYLITHHDTIIYVDEATQRLRHGPFGIAPMNLILEVAGSLGNLIFSGNDSPASRKLSFVQATGEICWLSDTADPDFQIEPIGAAGIALRARGSGSYVGAPWDGMIRNDISHCRAFEQFRLLRSDTFDGLAILQHYSWISHHDGEIVTLAPQPIDFGHQLPPESSALAATLAAGALECRRDIVFGPARIRLVGRASQIVFERANDNNPNRPLDVFITDVTGTRYGFSRLTSSDRESDNGG